MVIEQPWGDSRLKIDGVYIGCVKKEIADYIMQLQADNTMLRFAAGLPATDTKEVVVEPKNTCDWITVPLTK